MSPIRATEIAKTLRLERVPRPAGAPGRAVTLILDRPPLQVMDLATLEALDRTLASLGEDPEFQDLQVLFVRGAGERAFSAGVAIEDHVPERVEAMIDTFHSALHRLGELPAVTVAVVHGWCLGGGMELAMACDLRLATDEARFGQPEIDVGCYPPYAAALYPRLMPPGLAAELLLTGRRLSAEEAERAGLINWRVEPEELEARVEELATTLTSKSRAVTTLTLRALRAARRLPFDQALAESERIYREELTRTADMREGIQAFLEKRPARWEGR